MAQLFYAYATQDARYRDQLELALRGLKQRGVLAGWHALAVGPGSGWRGEASSHVEEAAVVLLLVSRDFVSSEYGHSDDVRRALERHRRGEARLIPVVLRPCTWKDTPFGGLPALPPGGKPVTALRSNESAFDAVAAGIAAALTRRDTPPAAATRPQEATASGDVARLAPAGAGSNGSAAAPAGAKGPTPAQVALQASELGAEYVPLETPGAAQQAQASGARYASVASLGTARTRTRRVAQFVDRAASPQGAMARLEAAVRAEVAKGGRVDSPPAAPEPLEPGVACRRVRVVQPAPSVSMFAAKGPFLVAAKVIDGAPEPTLPEDAAALAETVVRRMLARIPREFAILPVVAEGGQTGGDAAAG